ncbi:MAG: hypothetical protein MUE36_06285 [Acidimicrobiales bacterium]|jgi:hypothetical protein|nr:hypothetical protein [Acidimicrobiales bacterium]
MSREPEHPDGGYTGWTEAEEAHFWTVGGGSVLPSGFDEIARPPYRPYPSATYAWLGRLLGAFLLIPSVIGLAVGVRAALKGNRWGWAASVFCVLTAVFWVWVITGGLSSPPDGP